MAKVIINTGKLPGIVFTFYWNNARYKANIDVLSRTTDILTGRYNHNLIWSTENNEREKIINNCNEPYLWYLHFYCTGR